MNVALFSCRDSRFCHPRDFRSKAFDVVLFPFQDGGRYKHGEVSILNPEVFDLFIKPAYREW